MFVFDVSVSADTSSILRGSQHSFAAASHNALLANTPQARKLKAAAGEFESLLLSNLWKSMKSTFASSDDDASDPAHDTLEDMGIQAMSSAVGKAGGLGLGKLILKHLESKLENSYHSNYPQPGKAFVSQADISL